MADDPTVMQQRTDTAEPPATQLEGGNGGNHNSPEKATDRKTQENLEGNSKPDPMTTEAGKGGSTGGDASNRGTSKPDTRRRDSHEGDPTANTKGREDMRNRPLDFIEVDKEMTKSPERVKPLTVDDVRNKSEKIPDAKLSQGDKDSFKDGKYETVQLKEPMTVYRYFGAHTPDEMSSLGLKNDQWGSDAGGRFLATNPDMTPDEAKQRLALKTDWGNNEAYLSTIELPAGTKICVGTVGEQKDLDGSILPGGETQIILLPENGNKEAWTTDNTKNWIKKCEPIGDAEPKVERSVENDTDRPLGDTAQNNQPLEAPARSEKPAEGSSEAMPKSDAPVENGTENDRPLEAPAGADRSTEGNTDTPAEGGEKSTEDKTLNQFGNKEAPEYDEGKTDLQNAQDDLDFANSQLEEYNRAVEAGEIEPNENTEQQLQDSIEYAQGHLDEIKNGQAYSYDSPGEYWASPEGREIAGDLYGTGLDMTMKGVEKVVGAEIPFGDNTVSDTSKNFGRTYGENYGYKDIGKAADLSQDLMENARNTYATEGDRYMQDNFMRDENGSPINAEQGRDRAFGHQEPTMHDNLHDPELFRKNAPGAYTYENGDGGKKAYGTLEVSSDGVRDAQAQRNAGGEDRKADDDGGHLIGTRFNGAPDSRNLDAQNSNLNRGSYNHREKTWQDAVNNGDKVYVNVETPRSNGSERPDAYMGYSITEHPDGSREWDAFSYQNASKAEQEAWNKELEDFDSQLPEDYDNPMKEVYDREGYNGDTEVKTEAAPKSETVTEGKPEAAPKSVETNEKSNGKLTESVGTSDMKKGDTSESIDSTDPKEIAEKLKNSQQEAYNEKLKKEDMRKTELNESLPKIDAELKGYIKDNGMDKYISKKKLDAPITKNTEALREDEMQKKYEKHGGEWRPYIKGFNDGKVSSVSVKMSDGDFKETVIHENYHQLSANDTSIGSLTLKSRRGVCINGKNDGLNEAMTQNYTLNTLKTTDPSYVSTDCAYNDAAKYVGELYNYGNNKELFDKAYFQNKPELLQQHIDKYCGEGTFSEMSKCFDTAATDPFATAAERQEALNKISDIVNLYKFNREME